MQRVSLNDHMRHIVDLDRKLLTYRGAEVVSLDEWKQLKQQRKAHTSAIENAPRGNTR